MAEGSMSSSDTISVCLPHLMNLPRMKISSVPMVDDPCSPDRASFIPARPDRRKNAVLVWAGAETLVRRPPLDLIRSRRKAAAPSDYAKRKRHVP